MANTTTNVPMNETHQVVIEPEKPSQPRLKQFVALRPIEIHRKSYKVGDQVRLTETDAIPHVASNHLIPLEVAINQGLFPVSKETLPEKIVEAVTGENIPDTPAEVKAEILAGSSASGGKKSFLSNALREAIQKKKTEIREPLPPTKIDAAKLAAIKAGGKK